MLVCNITLICIKNTTYPFALILGSLAKGELLLLSQTQPTIEGSFAPNPAALSIRANLTISLASHYHTWLPCQRELDCGKAFFILYIAILCDFSNVNICLALFAARLRDRLHQTFDFRNQRKRIIILCQKCILAF